MHCSHSVGEDTAHLFFRTAGHVTLMFVSSCDLQCTETSEQCVIIANRMSDSALCGKWEVWVDIQTQPKSMSWWVVFPWQHIASTEVVAETWIVFQGSSSINQTRNWKKLNILYARLVKFGASWSCFTWRWWKWPLELQFPTCIYREMLIKWNNNLACCVR